MGWRLMGLTDNLVHANLAKLRGTMLGMRKNIFYPRTQEAAAGRAL